MSDQDKANMVLQSMDGALDSGKEESEESSVGVTVVEINHVAERKLVRRMDLHLIPTVMLLYLFSFLDRVNIGNARLYGMEADLGLVGQDFQTAVSVFFVTFLVFEVPSNLVLKKFTPSRFIASITILWGIIATCTGLVQNYAGLLACRLLLGVVDAGLFPCLAIYLTFFYTKKELALRIGYLFASAALAGACGGLLAYGIGYMDYTSGMRGWRWIMIIEGIPTCILGAAVFFILPNDAEHAGFLSAEEKYLVILRKNREVGQTLSAQKYHRADVKKAFTSWQNWAFYCAQFGCGTMLYGYSTFLPTIIKGLGTWTSPEVQALTIPCYTLGAIAYLIVAYLSDRYQQRGLFVVLFGIISIIGYALLISPVSNGVHYFACFVVATGLYVLVGLPLAWLPSNAPRYGKRTAGTGMQLTIGTASGIMSSFIYPTAEGPRFIKGHTITMAMVAFSTCVFAFMTWWFTKTNKNRAEGKEDYKIVGLTDAEIEELGDESPRFVYTK